MKKELIPFLIIMIIGFVSAVEFDFDNLNCQDLLEFKGEIIGGEIPSQIPYSDEVFNIYISEQIFGTLSLEESIITNFDCIENENVTYDIYIKDSSVLGEIIDAEENFIEVFNEKMSSDEIRIEGIGFGKKFKMFFTKLALKVLGWFS